MLKSWDWLLLLKFKRMNELVACLVYDETIHWVIKDWMDVGLEF
jgi:hypothetical protein